MSELVYKHTNSYQLEPRKRSSAKIGTIQRRLAWPLRKDDTHKSRMYHFCFLNHDGVLHELRCNCWHFFYLRETLPEISIK